ncbi:MAG: elongation factor G [Rhodospirillaceae bacterium]|jgi:elongation factor G|nr:elongation factor G [Rhodospirillaceae bacterium]MBT5195130.1 elongation factor G [Rhodospirillaceae bacterium]MBT5895093.1 elongation factor G [Rhodospirillaceae bacterium]
MTNNKPTGPRSIAIIGPYLSGKTTLLEGLLHTSGAINRKGTVTEGNTVGDSAQEARNRNMSTELNVASATFMDSELTFLDCPGSIELLQESLFVLPGVDAAVVVCEPDSDKAQALAPLLHNLDEAGIPHMLFVNKIDKATITVQALLDALQPISSKPLVLRHIPVQDGEEITGYIDLASERAYHYQAGQASEVVELPGSEEDAFGEARYTMLEALADFDDDLMEKVLEDITPEKDELYANLTKDFQDGNIIPVLLGAAEQGGGIFRLLKALRHEVPTADAAAARAGADDANGNVAQVLKTYHTQHGGKVSVARVWAGELTEGMSLNGQRVSGIFRMMGHEQQKIPSAKAGEVIGLGRMEEAVTGETLSDSNADSLPKPDVLPPVFGLTIAAAHRDDEVKLSSALAKVRDEDPSISIGHDDSTHQLVMRGQGDIHLKITMDRLLGKYGLEVKSERPKVPYMEAIRKSVEQHGRHKKQSGGHGQFGDVHLAIKPLPRGSGFEFVDKIVGGAIPRQYIPAVEAGVKEYLIKGPLGFPVVDVSVTAFDGQYHAVDSSEIAFKTAARIAMNEGMKQCNPVLLEPILQVDIAAPTEHTPKINAIVSGRRGQILGFNTRVGWTGWDVVSAHMPQSELHDLIIELRSATQGTGSYTAEFDRLQELTGRLADDVVTAHNEEVAA